MRLLIVLFFTILVIFPNSGFSQDEKKKKSKSDTISTGWTFGGVPAVAYDRDVGFKYGAIVNVYNFGDGSRYPQYDHSLYFEWTNTTKQSMINQFVYDSDRLIPGLRTSAEVSYFIAKALDFYGFNG